MYAHEPQRVGDPSTADSGTETSCMWSCPPLAGQGRQNLSHQSGADGSTEEKEEQARFGCRSHTTTKPEACQLSSRRFTRARTSTQVLP